MLFQEAEIGAFKEYRIRGRKMVNEAKYEIAALRKQYGDDILVEHPTDPNRIGTVAIPKGERGQGVGTRLFDAIKKRFIGEGKDRIEI